MPEQFLSNGVLRLLLDRASVDERLALSKILNPSATSAMKSIELQKNICQEGGHGVANFFRGQGTGYIDILDDTVDALKIKGLPTYHGKSVHKSLSLWEIDEIYSINKNKRNIEECRRVGIAYTLDAENKILIHVLEKTYNNMASDQKKIFDARVREVANQFGVSSAKSLAGGAGLLVLGNLGGFATYTLMTSVLSTLSFGALGFGAYTAASSLLGFVLGPAGWIAMGGAAIHAIGKPELKKIIPLVINVAAVRQRINYSSIK